jgi:hypothetical protein
VVEIFSLDSLLSLITYGSFLLLMFYGQRIQMTVILLNVRRKLGRLEIMRAESRKRFVDTTRRYQSGENATDKVDRLINSFAIPPVSLDPNGIVGKLEHILNTYDEHLKTEVRTLAASASEAEINNLTNLLEVSIGLDTMYRVVRHYYLLARKGGRMIALAQLQMSLPTIMEEAEAYHAGIEAFAEGKPVGDGVGPLVASSLVSEGNAKEIVRDTVLYETMFEGRKVLIVRAKGPGGNVGKPGMAVEKLIQETGPISLVVTVDAALKMEGESSGEIAEGVGAAIGGPGIERYRIEEAAAKHSVPMLAVVVKMSSQEAISPITETRRKSVPETAARVRQRILEWTKLGETAIVAGIGNTIGTP